MLHSNLRHTQTYVPLSPNSIIWYWVHEAGKITTGLADSTGNRHWIYGYRHLQAYKIGPGDRDQF